MSSNDPLEQISVPSPCSADWDSMIGNNRIRFCEHCNLNVHDLSAMTRNRAMRLVLNSRGRLCVRFLEAPNGGPRTNVPKLIRISKRATRLAAGAFTCTISLASAAAAQTFPQQVETLAGAEQSLWPQEQKSPSEVPSASVTGTAMDGKGHSLAGAVVTLKNRGSGVELIASADADGNYLFQSLQPGSYELTGRAEGYPEAKTEISLTDNERRQINLRLSDEPLRFTGGVVVMRTPSHPLIAAAYKNDLDALKQQLFAGADADMIDRITSSTALDYAVENNNREMMQLLISARADVNGAGGKRGGALMFLREDATPELVLDLIAAGAQVNQQDEDGNTPLLNAAAMSNLNVIKTLVKSGARVDLVNHKRETPLMRASANDDPNLLKFLLRLGADVNARNDEGQTALLQAASSGKPELIKALLDAGAKVNVRDSDHQTPLLSAAAEDDSNVVKLLLDAGADIDARDKDGQTAVMIAASNAPANIVKLLIDAGAAIDTRDNDGQTALMCAASVGDAEAVRLLLQAGADVTQRDKNGKTALSLAGEENRAEVVQLLQARGAP